MHPCSLSSGDDGAFWGWGGAGLAVIDVVAYAGVEEDGVLGGGSTECSSEFTSKEIRKDALNDGFQC
jgi:hypothetical protein